MKTTFNKLYHGADYNPEQWKDYPGVIDEDMRLMKLSKCNVMSINIFGWTEIEPAEGVYDFTFLDYVMDKLAENGVKAILATPSGARPAWMSKAHPEVLRTNADRTVNLHGQRHNHCLTSPYYRKKVYEINRRLAERYKDHPALLMWHLSNEYGGECHCEMCRAKFVEWLKKKYNNDLDDLNAKYWTKFWSHTYTDWNQIEPPSPLGETAVHALNLDWKRFTTEQVMDFIENEVAPLREFTPDTPVSANFMELNQNYDYYKLRNVVDVISWDNYPRWHSGDDVAMAQYAAFQHDNFRSFKSQPFFLMESTPSLVNWQEYNKMKRPGMHILSSLQAVAHGSDSVQYFQWRKSRGSSEKMHGAVVDHCGHEHTRVFKEVAKLGDILENLSEVAGTNSTSDVAVIFEWENRWALNDMQGLIRDDKKYNETCVAHYAPFWQRGVNVDVIDSLSDWSKYKLVVAPMLYKVKTGIPEKIAEYVKNGGNVVFTYASGWVDENDLCHLGGFPAGKLKDVFGIWAEEIDVLYPDEHNTVEMSDGKNYKAIDYCEILHANEADVLATFKDDFYAGSPAVTVNNYGKGKAYYIAFRDCGDFLDKFYGDIVDELGLNGEIGDMPYGVTAHTRESDTDIYTFVQNYTTESCDVVLSNAYTDVLSGETVSDKITLPKYGVKVLKRSKGM